MGSVLGRRIERDKTEEYSQRGPEVKSYPYCMRLPVTYLRAWKAAFPYRVWAGAGT